MPQKWPIYYVNTDSLVHALINDFDPQDAVNYAIAASILKLTIKGDSNLVTADEIAAVASAADGGTRVAR
ncbi:MAG: hypothetical protein UE141_09325 [Collinsella sp.]|nr:hypothetical protein [Collinsella sp.]